MAIVLLSRRNGLAAACAKRVFPLDSAFNNAGFACSSVFRNGSETDCHLVIPALYSRRAWVISWSPATVRRPDVPQTTVDSKLMLYGPQFDHLGPAVMFGVWMAQ